MTGLSWAVYEEKIDIHPVMVSVAALVHQLFLRPQHSAILQLLLGRLPEHGHDPPSTARQAEFSRR